MYLNFSESFNWSKKQWLKMLKYALFWIRKQEIFNLSVFKVLLFRRCFFLRKSDSGSTIKFGYVTFRFSSCWWRSTLNEDKQSKSLKCYRWDRKRNNCCASYCNLFCDFASIKILMSVIGYCCKLLWRAQMQFSRLT